MATTAKYAAWLKEYKGKPWLLLGTAESELAAWGLVLNRGKTKNARHAEAMVLPAGEVPVKRRLADGAGGVEK